MDIARDIEFAQGREGESRRIGRLPSVLQAAARVAFEKESQDLEIARRSEREMERQGKGDCFA